MRTSLIVLLSLFSLQISLAQEPPAVYAIVIHGGAGNISPQFISPERADALYAKLSEVLENGISILDSGGTSLDAVEAVIRIMEDSPLFNAGKGAVYTHEGKNELDASIMDGKTLNAGAVAGIGDIKNPISAAQIVMEKSPHILLSGKGASRFVASHGGEVVDSNYFYTERRWKQLQQQLKKDQVEKYGTVGCVALDSYGNLAAGTSTGGMSNKRYGRIGDSPIIGAGNYANNNSCAVSATGHGEYFIRYTVAHDISAMMQYSDLSIQEAASAVIQEKLKEAGGRGGVICVDK
ncbi:MAG: isoaspartyl peptidase/L-asparaginase, partial [Bacteroidales bacterium]|nr:isoaspartyl peptidase/L-asparaginase [Bacteroidales bacterium]